VKHSGSNKSTQWLDGSPVLRPQPGEALVRVKAVGICGSDIHFWKDGGIGPLRIEEPYILGHEAAGVVIECAKDVTSLQHGDRVAFEASLPCESQGVYPTNGTLQRYSAHPAKLLHKLPDNVSFAEGALLEPLSVAMQGIKDAGGIPLGSGSLVCGAGTIGLCTLAAARSSGAHPIVITDVVPARLDLAKKLVPQCITYQINTRLTSEENSHAIRALYGSTEYSAPETVFECSGVDSSAIIGLNVIRKQGKFIALGVGNAQFDKFPSGLLMGKMATITYSSSYYDTWPAGIALMSGGLLDLKSLVTHRFPLERAVEAFQIASDPQSGYIKVQIVDELE
ncbi:sorbitol dehydrogenase, partial [Fusarium albosuccineum]